MGKQHNNNSDDGRRGGVVREMNRRGQAWREEVRFG